MSTSGDRPEPGDGVPPAPTAARRGLRDHPLGRILLLLAVLGIALFAARTCASQNKEISQEEAVEIAVRFVGFEPCAESVCLQIRYLQQGIPVRGYWLVGLAESLDENGEPVRPVSVLVDVQTGEATRA